MKAPKSLSRRERQIMDIVYEMKEATALQVLEKLPSPPSYSAVRAHRQDGPRYVYKPLLPKEKASRNALQHLLKTFFDNSTEDVVAALLDISEEDLSEEDYIRLLDLIRNARKEGR
jgi:BlaI family penicillinase repressor